MNWQPKSLLSAVFAVVLAGVTGLVTWWLMRTPTKSVASAKSEPPASVSNVLKETDLIVITLKPEAATRLGLQTIPVTRRDMPRRRTYGAEVIVPPGQTITMSAPLTGTVRAHGEKVIRPGATVTKDQPILTFTPVLSADTRANLAMALVEAEGQVKSSQAQIDATTKTLTRAQQLVAQDAGTRRALDDATAQVEQARKTHEAAEARRSFLAKVGPGAPGLAAVASQIIQAPAAGMIRQIQPLTGETVPAGAVLFEILRLDPLWIRVPVYVGDLAELNFRESADLARLADRADSPTLRAKPATAPPSASFSAATVDLYYELTEGTDRFAPGQRLGARLALTGQANELVVPWSAVIHDIHGGTWVYERLDPQRYARRRVSVRRVEDGLAVLATGPAEGVNIVTAGAAELFGTEVGFAK